jgi:hypothetical protein
MREFLKKENYATCTTEIFGPFQVCSNFCAVVNGTVLAVCHAVPFAV